MESFRPNGGHILLPRRFVDVGMAPSRVAAKGRYQIVKYDAGGNELERTPWFDNLILNAGLDRWGTATIISGAAIGTGTSTPLVTDVGLQTQSSWTAETGPGDNTATVGVSPNYNSTRTFVYRTALGALNGNYTEVGVGWDTGSAMFSRALIVNAGGTPTSISVTSTQQLDIVYQLSIYPPLLDVGPSTVTISGVDYTVTGRAANVTNLSYYWTVGRGPWGLDTNYSSASNATALGAITGVPTGATEGESGFSTVTQDPYISGTYTNTGYFTCGLTVANFPGGISAFIISWSSNATFQYLVSPAIPKDGTKTLVTHFSVTWGRRP